LHNYTSIPRSPRDSSQITSIRDVCLNPRAFISTVELIRLFQFTCVNFTDMFTRSFYTQRSQKRKKTDKLTVFFVFLGSVCVKAERKMLMNLTPGINFTTIIRATFFYKCVLCSFSLLTVWHCNFCQKNTSQKSAH